MGNNDAVRQIVLNNGYKLVAQGGKTSIATQNSDHFEKSISNTKDGLIESYDIYLYDNKFIEMTYFKKLPDSTTNVRVHFDMCKNEEMVQGYIEWCENKCSKINF